MNRKNRTNLRKLRFSINKSKWKDSRYNPQNMSKAIDTRYRAIINNSGFQSLPTSHTAATSTLNFKFTEVASGKWNNPGERHDPLHVLYTLTRKLMNNLLSLGYLPWYLLLSSLKISSANELEKVAVRPAF